MRFVFRIENVDRITFNPLTFRIVYVPLENDGAVTIKKGLCFDCAYHESLYKYIHFLKSTYLFNKIEKCYFVLFCSWIIVFIALNKLTSK